MKRILLIALVCLNANASDNFKLAKQNIRASESLGKVSVFHGKEGFMVKNKGTIHHVNSYDVEKPLRNLTPDQVKRLQMAGGLLKVNKLSNGDFTVGMDNNLKGGGYFSGVAAGWVVRTLGYGAVTTAASIAAANLVAVAPAAAGVGIKMAAGAGVQAMGLTGAGKVAAIGMVNTKVAGDIAVAVAAVGPQVVAVVEGAALSAQCAVTLIPWLP